MASKLETDLQILKQAQERGRVSTLGAYFRLSGPGWLQSAITLGGGSLASSLYLGVLAGPALLWLQPLAMILGIIMLSAIGYVTLSTGQGPFRAINTHVNPVLGWGWALAVAAANIVFCLPQYSLAHGVLTQNLFSSVLGEAGWMRSQFDAESWMGMNASKLVIVIVIFCLTTFVTWSYDRGGWGLKLYETMLKFMVGLIVVCFVGVVIVLTRSGEGIDWETIGRGFIPDFRKLFAPSDTFLPLLDAIGGAGDSARQFWESQIVSQQRDVMISAAATAVGINMTFLFAYSMLRKGWTKEFRGLAIFDLATGMFIPFVLATSSVVIASASQFHAKLAGGFVVDEAALSVTAPPKFEKKYLALISQRPRSESIAAKPSLAEQKLAATLVRRDASDLALSLEPLTGRLIADITFGVGVLAMTISTITLLMLISGFVFCEILGLPHGGWPHRIGTLLAGVGGMLGPFLWGSEKATFYLAVPTSVFGFTLMPLAYLTFFLLMNQKSLLREEAPRRFKRIVWNVLMGVSAITATVASVTMIWVKAGYAGIVAVAAFVLLAVLVQINRYNNAKRVPGPDESA